jgi:hypothetical protein
MLHNQIIKPDPDHDCNDDEELCISVSYNHAITQILTEHQAMKAYWGSGCIAPLIL